MATLPSATWQMLEQRISDKPLPRGLDAAWDVGIGLIDGLKPRRKMFLRRAKKVLALEKHFSQISDANLRKDAGELREIFRRQRETQSDIERAFALVREVADRQIGNKPFPVQIAGAFAIDHGCIVEMATGEGKTLTATMPATVAGWRGRGCHIITVNDYLAQRDAEWMGRIYRFCGLSVAHIEQAMSADDRRAAYQADITYCTNKEVSADFLRDRLALGRVRGLSSALLAKITRAGQSIIDRLVQRGLNFAIIDEADSVLVDEAVTPLIISGPAPNPEQVEAFRQAADIVSNLRQDTDYRINARYREVELTNEGKDRLAQSAGTLGDIWQGARRREEIATKALVAKELYSLDKQYVIDEGKVVIVDDFTGRLMPDRSWRDGLHQAVEAKEKLEITPPKDTYARISFQRFFRMYHKLSGMTGTASEAAAEFWQIYHLPVVVIPTNRPCKRKNPPDIILPTGEAKWKRILLEIRRVHEKSRPVLVGTRSVQDSEYISQMLDAENLNHQVLNAVRHREEAQIIAGAGQAGKITVATNMAGRGTDIKLGRGVAESGGLHVIASERNESGRIDRQLFGRCARQGDPGSAQAIVSLEDEFVSRYAKNIIAYLKKRHAFNTKGISSNTTRAAFSLAQRRAEKLALRQRKSVMRTDHWLEEQLSFSGRE
ncbi:MAG: preprotein translocase subunit SecA [Planctomycetes bacterium]|nr:preprotein translocase subunit SecA [Planctomycetota bacterium]MBL7145486.1 preprotein translocase subunit SecA [Phycisphaerae bacterium]